VVGDNVGYRAGEVAVSDLLMGLTERVGGLAGILVEPVQVAQVDSKDMGPPVWGPLLRNVQCWLSAPEVKAVVITHGTDTLEETAYLLGRVLRPEKPVVLTCAMRPATALVPDGPQNLLDALSVALDGRAAGVHVVAAGWVHAARDISKVHTYRQDAFSSGDVGPVGCVEEGRLRWFGKAVPHGSQAAADLVAMGGSDVGACSPASWPRVEIITSHSGATGDLVDAMLLQANGPRPLRGLVVAGTGNGTLHHELDAALLRARAAGVVVWRTSRCAFGQVVGSSDVPEASDASADGVAVPPCWPASALSPVKARIELMLQLMQPLAERPTLS
jgi:L-asparaginase